MEIEELANHVAIPCFSISLGVAGHLGSVLGIQITKFMVLEVIAAGLMILMFTGLARRIKSGAAAKGSFWNALGAIARFIRDEVARPWIGKHDADKYLPLLWNLFFFILCAICLACCRGPARLRRRWR